MRSEDGPKVCLASWHHMPEKKQRRLEDSPSAAASCKHRLGRQLAQPGETSCSGSGSVSVHFLGEHPPKEIRSERNKTVQRRRVLGSKYRVTNYVPFVWESVEGEAMVRLRLCV